MGDQPGAFEITGKLPPQAGAVPVKKPGAGCAVLVERRITVGEVAVVMGVDQVLDGQRRNRLDGGLEFVVHRGELAVDQMMPSVPTAIVTLPPAPSRDRIQKLVDEGKTEQEVLAADLDAKWAADNQQAQNWTKMVYNSFNWS